MKRSKNKHLQFSNPELWQRLSSILHNFPVAIEPHEYELRVHFDKPIKLKGGYSHTTTYKYFDPHPNKSIDIRLDRPLPDPSIGRVFVDRLTTILTKYKSVAEYLENDYTSRMNQKAEPEESFAPFDRIPLGKLFIPKLTSSIFVIEAYLRRRTINSLLNICYSIGPSLFFNNKKFLAALELEAQNKGSNFFKAVRIEPMLLQSKIGLDILCDFSLWYRMDIHQLGVALKPKGNAKIKNFWDTSSHTEQLSKALMVLMALEPKVDLLTDEECLDLLSEKRHGYCPPNYKLDSFIQLRQNVFLKKGRKK